MPDRRDFETMWTEREDGVLTLTLNRPDRLNAFTNHVMEDWLTVLGDSTRALIVTGAGRGLYAGADRWAEGTSRARNALARVFFAPC
jgi:enoyl-CoA hydratase/carnithine racemase